jgi:hypothetical protein
MKVTKTNTIYIDIDNLGLAVEVDPENKTVFIDSYGMDRNLSITDTLGELEGLCQGLRKLQ